MIPTSHCYIDSMTLPLIFFLNEISTFHEFTLKNNHIEEKFAYLAYYLRGRLLARNLAAGK